MCTTWQENQYSTEMAGALAALDRANISAFCKTVCDGV